MFTGSFRLYCLLFFLAISIALNDHKECLGQVLQSPALCVFHIALLATLTVDDDRLVCELAFDGLLQRFLGPPSFDN